MKLILFFLLLLPFKQGNIHAEVVDCISVRPRIEQGCIEVESALSGDYYLATSPYIEVIKSNDRVFWDKNKEIVSVIINFN